MPRSKGLNPGTLGSIRWPPPAMAADAKGRLVERELRGASVEAYAAFEQQVAELVGEGADSGEVLLPPYYPADRILLEDWALYLDSVRVTDNHVGRVLKRLETEGLL